MLGGAFGEKTAVGCDVFFDPGEEAGVGEGGCGEEILGDGS